MAPHLWYVLLTCFSKRYLIPLPFAVSVLYPLFSLLALFPLPNCSSITYCLLCFVLSQSLSTLAPTWHPAYLAPALSPPNSQCFLHAFLAIPIPATHVPNNRSLLPPISMSYGAPFIMLPQTSNSSPYCPKFKCGFAPSLPSSHLNYFSPSLTVLLNLLRHLLLPSPLIHLSILFYSKH